MRMFKQFFQKSIFDVRHWLEGLAFSLHPNSILWDISLCPSVFSKQFQHNQKATFHLTRFSQGTAVILVTAKPTWHVHWIDLQLQKTHLHWSRGYLNLMMGRVASVSSTVYVKRAFRSSLTKLYYFYLSNIIRKWHYSYLSKAYGSYIHCEQLHWMTNRNILATMSRSHTVYISVNLLVCMLFSFCWACCIICKLRR